jgi:hypothetical protein
MTDLNRDAAEAEARTSYSPAAVAEINRSVSRENRTAWWVAGAVAVVAILAVAFMVTRPASGPTNDQLTAAADQGHAMGVIEGAQSASQSNLAASQAAANAQAAAAQAQAQAASQSAADRAASQQAAADAQRAAAAAQAGSDAAARSADSAAADAQAPTQ